MKKIIFISVCLLLIPVWVIVYYNWLEWPLYNVFIPEMPHEIYDVKTGKCVNYLELKGQSRYTSVPLWSRILNKVTEWSVLIVLPGLIILGYKIAKDYLVIKDFKFLCKGLFFFSVILIAYWSAIEVVINS